MNLGDVLERVQLSTALVLLFTQTSEPEISQIKTSRFLSGDLEWKISSKFFVSEHCEIYYVS